MSTVAKAERDKIELIVEEYVKNLLKDSYKDEHVIEIELTEKISKRLVEWAKMFGLAAGIPVTVVVCILGYYGITSSNDAHKMHDSIAHAEEYIQKKSDDFDNSVRLKTSYLDLAYVNEKHDFDIIATRQTELLQSVADEKRRVEELIQSDTADLAKRQEANREVMQKISEDRVQANMLQGQIDSLQQLFKKVSDAATVVNPPVAKPMEAGQEPPN